MTNRAQTSKSVRNTQDRLLSMPRNHDNLPRNPSFVDNRIGQLVGIFQIDRQVALSNSDGQGLPDPNTGMLGLVAVADGGRLTENAFNVWSIASQMFREAGCPDTERIDFNLSEYTRRLWGPKAKSATLRARIADAFTELARTNVVVVGIDPYTGEPSENAKWQLNLIEGAGVRSHIQPIIDAARGGDLEARSRLSSLATSAADEKATWSLVLPKWLALSIRRGHGVILDYEVQRSLRGAAKRIWVQLETYQSWRTHRLTPSTRDVTELARELFTHAADISIEPADDEPATEIQTLTLPLDDDIYNAFGLTHANRKRALEAACANILATDTTYLAIEIRQSRRGKRKFDLHLARAAGALRQERHRAALRRRVAPPPSERTAPTV